MADGHLNKCKDCQKKSSNDARQRNIEAYREYDRKRANLPHRIQARRDYQDSDAGREKASKAKRDYSLRYPDKNKARYAVANAIRDGKLFRKPCEVCGNENSEAHHPDYSQPLLVMWLCDYHHKELHKREREDRRKGRK
jgi:hypothetical protein